MTDTVKGILVDNHQKLEAALPPHINAGDFVRLALTEVQRTPRLADCDPQSVFLALMEAARLGVVPGTLGHGWLLPRKVKGRMQCQFQPGYRLFIDLARRSGEVLRVDAHVVYEGDDFRMTYGTDPVLEHTPKITGERGAALGAYAVAHLKGGGVQVTFMATEEVEKARAAGAKDSPAWVTWWGEMAKKVVLRRASKLWPLSVEDQRVLERVVTVDNDAEGYSEPAVVEPARPLLERAVTYTEGGG